MSVTTTTAAFPFYAAMMEEADRCRRRAHEAIKEGHPVLAREWFEAAEAAYRAATANVSSGGGTPQVRLVTPWPPSPPGLGKNAICSYCGGALWACRGVHVTC